MAGVASAAIIEGSLIIGLDDGSIINCGFVQGPQGLKGDPGPMGATGERGTDGNTIHTVAGTPRNDMGTDGDYAIDNANWRIYGPKSGGTWGKAKEMLPGPENVLENGRFTAATGGGGGTTGSSDSTDIIVGPNTPNLGDSITGLKQGQLWFDSEQLALYILIENSNSERVWVITIPADRSALQDQVTGFKLPPASRIDNGTTVYNTTTGLWYYYNKPKNQWIDLPPGENTLQLRTFLVQAPADIDENFQYIQADRDNYGTNALTYINDAEHAPTTRIVVSKTDLDDFNWSLLLSSIIEGDQLTLLQVEPGDIGLGTDDRSLRTDYLVVSPIKENTESFSFEVEYQQQNEGHNPRFGGFVSIEFQAVVNQTSGTYYQDTAPIDDGSLKPGNLWVESDTLLGHVWTGKEWAQLGDAASSGFNVKTSDVKTEPLTGENLPNLPYEQLFQQLNSAERADEIPNPLDNQRQLNEEVLYTLFNQRRKTTRVKTTTGFINKTSLRGEWQYDSTGQPDSLPPEGKFHLFDINDQPNSHWEDVVKIRINGTGRNLESLATIRKGTNIEFQDVLINTAANLIVVNVDFIGSPQGGQFWVELLVKPAYDQAFGFIPEGAVTEITLSSPHPCITTSGLQSAPLVDDDGYLWYDEVSQQLFVSDWDDSQDENGVAEWLPVGESVFIGEFAPTASEKDGRMWFQPSTKTLYIYVVTDAQTGDGEWMVVAGGDADLNAYLKKDGSVVTTGRLKHSSDYGISYDPIDIGTTTITSNGQKPTEDTLPNGVMKIWHLDDADATTNPPNKIMLRWDGAEDYVDNHEGWTGLTIVGSSGGMYMQAPNAGFYASADHTIWHFEATYCENLLAPLVEGEEVTVRLESSGRNVFYATDVDAAIIAQAVVDKALDGADLDGDYLPITGGTLEGNLNVEGQLKVSEGNEFKLQYAEDTTMFRIQPNANQITSKASVLNLKSVPGDALSGRAGLDIQVQNDNPVAISNTGSYQSTFEIYGYDGNEPGGRGRNLSITAAGNINTEGNVNAQSFVKGSELRSTKLTSGQSSNLEIYRGSGDNEQRKMLIGTDSVNFDVDIKLVSSSKKDIIVQNGTKLYAGGDEIITFGGSGAFYRGTISTDDHIINKGYADALVEDGPFLPLAGGEMAGPITSNRGQGDLAFRVEKDSVHTLTIWNDGVIESTRTGFSDNHLVTKKYVDDKVDSGGGSSFSPGDPVAVEGGSTAAQTNGFFKNNGNLYFKA